VLKPDPGAGGVSAPRTTVCHEASKKESTVTIDDDRQARPLPATRLNHLLLAGGGVI